MGATEKKVNLSNFGLMNLLFSEKYKLKFINQKMVI